MNVKRNIVLSLIVVLSTTSYDSSAITVNPALCPTNKIAPHRRIANQNARTFGHIAQLFNENQLQVSGPSSLQEEPQADDPEDCGDIEDYDETDLSSVTPQRKRADDSENRFFFHHDHYPQNRPPNRPPNQPNPPYRPPNQPNQPPYRPPNQPNQPPYRPPNQPNQPPYRPPNQQPNPPQRPPMRPVRPTPPPTVRPQRPPPPIRPPYSSGGMFGNNFYRPPPYHEHYPSDNVKPVYEDGQEPPQATYRPGVVGGPLGQIVGVSQVRPTSPQYDQDVASTRRPYPMRERPSSQYDYDQRPQRPRRFNDSSVLGSFIDLLFK